MLPPAIDPGASARSDDVPLIVALARAGLGANPTPAVRHQIQRLAAHWTASGRAADAARLKAVLAPASDDGRDGRLVPSAAGPGTAGGHGSPPPSRAAREPRLVRLPAMTDPADGPEVYVSLDVETDGPIPGPHSMLSLGAAAFTPDGALVDTFSVVLETLEGAVGAPETMAWWAERPAAWAAARRDPVPPALATRRFAAWVRALRPRYGTPVLVAYPLGFDQMFATWYLHRFTGGSPFRQDGIDVKSYAMALLGRHYRGSAKKHLPAAWQDGGVPGGDDLAHVAVDDAIQQGRLFCRLLAARRTGLVPAADADSVGADPAGMDPAGADPGAPGDGPAPGFVWPPA